MKWITHEAAAQGNEQHTTLIMMVDFVIIDTSGIASLENFIRVWFQVGNSHCQSKVASDQENWRVFLTVAEAIDCKLDC
ncbi:hypothetical protein HN873_009479 [Arachis hypogaea]